MLLSGFVAELAVPTDAEDVLVGDEEPVPAWLVDEDAGAAAPVVVVEEEEEEEGWDADAEAFAAEAVCADGVGACGLPNPDGSDPMLLSMIGGVAILLPVKLPVLFPTKLPLPAPAVPNVPVWVTGLTAASP